MDERMPRNRTNGNRGMHRHCQVWDSPGESSSSNNVTGDKKASRREDCRVYVGGVSDRVTENEYTRHFSVCGRVVEVVKHGDYAFVRFALPGSCDEAIRRLDGTVWMGRNISVQQPGQRRAWPTLYVGNLSDDIDERDLFELFDPHGTIRRIQLHSRYAFVEFNDLAALKAGKQLNGIEWWGRRLVVQLPHNNHHEVVVFGSPKGVGKEDYQSLFFECGPVLNVRQTSDMTFVELVDEEACDMAVLLLDNYWWMNQQIVVERIDSHNFSRKESADCLECVDRRGDMNRDLSALPRGEPAVFDGGWDSSANEQDYYQHRSSDYEGLAVGRDRRDNETSDGRQNSGTNGGRQRSGRRRRAKANGGGSLLPRPETSRDDADQVESSRREAWRREALENDRRVDQERAAHFHRQEAPTKARSDTTQSITTSNTIFDTVKVIAADDHHVHRPSYASDLPDAFPSSPSSLSLAPSSLSLVSSSPSLVSSSPSLAPSSLSLVSSSPSLLPSSSSSSPSLSPSSPSFASSSPSLASSSPSSPSSPASLPPSPVSLPPSPVSLPPTVPPWSLDFDRLSLFLDSLLPPTIPPLKLDEKRSFLPAFTPPRSPPPDPADPLGHLNLDVASAGTWALLQHTGNNALRRAVSCVFAPEGGVAPRKTINFPPLHALSLGRAVPGLAEHVPVPPYVSVDADLKCIFLALIAKLFEARGRNAVNMVVKQTVTRMEREEGS